MDISVVIPVRNRFDLTIRTLSAAIRLGPDEIVVVDDASDDATVNLPRSHNITYVRFAENRGFPRACNAGVAVSRGDAIILINNDVITQGDWIQPVAGVLEDGKLLGAQLVDWKAGWNEFESETVPYLAGWFLAFSRRTWDDLGGMDVGYGKGDFEDMDLSYAAQQRGIELVQVQVPIQHLGGQSYGFTEERRRRTERNRARFAQKWDLEIDA